MVREEDTTENQGRSEPDRTDTDKTKTRTRVNVTGQLPPHHPRQIGKFSLKRVIASGGMGTVFEGVQESPRRSVAIKVIKGSDVSEKAVGRLKYEAQMLARLRHPGIAEIYEAGTYEENGMEIPFFAMEYIPNAKTITEFAASKKLNVEQKLDLFLQVCDAVNYGHQRGIVHRDLKPENILVDPQGRVRIIDFGLAKATDSDLRQTNVQTEVGQIVGSLQYMSPEQFEADSSDLDTRSDVYSLGVVLYELLSGALPYDLKAKNVLEIAHIVREKKPLPLGKSGVKMAAELDVILQKALRKDRELRYQTAYGLGRDISRFLSGEAIDARPPSLAYQMRVFARRNKLLVGSLAATFILLAAGVAVSTSLLLKVNEERKNALIEAEKAKRAHAFLTDIFNTAIPEGFGDEVPISNLLDKSTKMLEGAFPEDPETEANIRLALARGYFTLGKYDDARENMSQAFRLRRESLGELHPETKSSLEELNSLFTVTGDFENYLDNCRQICRIDSLTYGSGSENTLSSQISVIGALERNGNIPDALRLAESAYELCTAEHPADLKLRNRAANHLAWLLLQSGQFDEAERLARESLETATARIEDGQYALRSKSVLAACLISKGELNQAMELYGNFPTYPDLDREYDIQGKFDPGKSDIHLVIFWEEWCPFCERMMKRAEKVYRQYHNYGIDIVGVAGKWWSTREECEDFLKEFGITFPIVKQTGKASTHFDVGGIPSIRLIYRGKLIWDKRVPSVEPISRHMLEGILKARQTASQ